MSKNAALVAESFVKGEYKAAGGFVSHGDAVYSYALKLAYHDGIGGVVYTDAMSDFLNDAKNNPQSKTTAGHIMAVHRAVKDGYAYGVLNHFRTEQFAKATVLRNDGTPYSEEAIAAAQAANAAKGA